MKRKKEKKKKMKRKFFLLIVIFCLIKSSFSTQIPIRDCKEFNKIGKGEIKK